MKKSIFKISAFLIIMIGILSFQGCSLLGYGIGSIIDDKKSVVDQEITVEGLDMIKPGALIKVLDKGGIIYKGIFYKIEVEEIQGDTLETIWIRKGDYFNKIFIGNIDRVIVLGKQRKGSVTGATIGGIIDAAGIGFTIWLMTELSKIGN